MLDIGADLNAQATSLQQQPLEILGAVVSLYPKVEIITALEIILKLKFL